MSLIVSIQPSKGTCQQRPHKRLTTYLSSLSAKRSASESLSLFFPLPESLTPSLSPPFSDMTKLQKCVVRVLEDCEESTPANLVDAMFRFVRNKTPCANMTTTADKLGSDKVDPDANSGMRFASSVLVIAVAAVFAMVA